MESNIKSMQRQPTASLPVPAVPADEREVK